MNRNNLLEVAFILDEIIKRKKVVKYTYQDKTLIVWYRKGKRTMHEAYAIGG